MLKGKSDFNHIMLKPMKLETILDAKHETNISDITNLAILIKTIKCISLLLCTFHTVKNDSFSFTKTNEGIDTSVNILS